MSVQAVSISVSPTSVNYGTLPFQASRPSTAAEAGSVTFTATNNGNVSESFLVRGTNASGAGLNWTLIEGTLSCPNVLNEFRHSVAQVSPSGAALFLNAIDQTWLTGIAATATVNFKSEIYTPRPGSSGTGAAASTTIVVTAAASP